MDVNEIIKALNWAFCHHSDVYGVTLYEILECIENQKEEIERLKKLLDNKCDRCIEQDKSEAIKEFAERLKHKITLAIDTYYNSNGGGYYRAEDVIDEMDELVKEMTGSD